MAIEKISAGQYVSLLQQGILGRDADWDVTVGEVPDLTIFPQSRVFELQHDDVRQVSLFVTLSDPTAFDGFEADLDGIIFNEGMTRQLGAQASVTLVFSRSTAPTSDVPVQRGFPIATVADESTGLTITFVTTETRTMFAASASSFFNTTTQRYELSVPAIATVEGAQTVGPGRVNRGLRPLVGFEAVANAAAAQGGLDRETNSNCIGRYLIAIIGRELATANGAKKITVDDFPPVSDCLVVGGTNPLLTRAGTDAGAVDAYIIGSEPLTQVDNPAFLGTGQLIPVSVPPLVSVVSVQDLSTGTTFTLGTDYVVMLDTTGVAGSTHAVDAIQFLPTGAAPTIGNPVTITFTYNNLIRRIQTALSQDDTLVEGRDLLFKQGVAVPVVLTAQLRVIAGFSTSLVQTAVIAAINAFFASVTHTNGLGLGAAVQGSDIQGVVRVVSGVDNFIITRLSRKTVPSGTADININPNEYATLASPDLTVTLI